MGTRTDDLIMEVNLPYQPYGPLYTQHIRSSNNTTAIVHLDIEQPPSTVKQAVQRKSEQRKT